MIYENIIIYLCLHRHMNIHSYVIVHKGILFIVTMTLCKKKLGVRVVLFHKQTNIGLYKRPTLTRDGLLGMNDYKA